MKNTANWLRATIKPCYALAGNAMLKRGAFDASLLEHWSAPENLSFPNRQKFRALRQALLDRYYSPGTSTTERERLKALCIGGKSSTRWAARYVREGFAATAADYERRPMFKWLECLCAGNDVRSIHQVGCSSGREIALFAKRFPKLPFVGSDVYEEVICFCRNTYADINNLRFTELDLTNATEVSAIESDIVFSSGTLPYIDQESIQRFLREVRAPGRHLLVGEPLSKNLDELHAVHSTKRDNFQWNHPYLRYLLQSGWTVEIVDRYLDQDLPTKSLSVCAVG